MAAPDTYFGDIEASMDLPPNLGKGLHIPYPSPAPSLSRVFTESLKPFKKRSKMIPLSRNGHMVYQKQINLFNYKYYLCIALLSCVGWRGNFMCCADYNEVEFMSGTNARITIKMSQYNL